jgi:hypothetical protein
LLCVARLACYEPAVVTLEQRARELIDDQQYVAAMWAAGQGLVRP